MFDSSYSYRSLGKQSGLPNANDFKTAWLYFFDDKFGNRYIARLEEFEHEVYFVKFHRRKDKNSNNKYRVQTNVNDSTRIIGTCIQIILDFLEHKCVTASFGAVGVVSEDEETQSPSQRFRIYELLFKNIFSDIDFIHADMPSANATFIVNRKAKVDQILPYLSELLS
ncbi:MAG: hypothetical protein AAGI23_09640 [Bacteroidota bacterium]